MFETILVPVDGSEPGWHALGEAIEVAHREHDGAVLHGLYVIDTGLLTTPYEYISEAEQVRASLQREGTAALEELSRRAAAAGVNARTELAEGEVGRVICERASLADLVVLGRSGKGGVASTLLFGSTFETVIRCSPRPVLVSIGEPRPIRRVLVAYDGSERAKDALEIVAREEWLRGAEVLVVSVVEPGRAGQETLDAAGSYLREHQIEPSLLLLPDQHPAAAILQVAEQRDIDLIALGGYGHGRFLEVFYGHTANEVLRGTKRPVLVCR